MYAQVAILSAKKCAENEKNNNNNSVDVDSAFTQNDVKTFERAAVPPEQSTTEAHFSQRESDTQQQLR